jgi:hypothetical protein
MMTTKFDPTAEDVAAIWSLREELLAQNWPASIPGAWVPATDADTCGGAEPADNLAFRVWAGRDRGGYRFPPFQFLSDGSVHPKLQELMAALARQPQLHPDTDKSGWERAFWLYLPRGRLSERALALSAATLKEVMGAPGRFAAIPDVARTPAEVFLDAPQAVIDLANEDADQHVPESAMY